MSEVPAPQHSRRGTLIVLGAIVVAGAAATPLLYLHSPAAAPAATLSAAAPREPALHTHVPLAADTQYSTVENEAAARTEVQRIFAGVRLPADAQQLSAAGSDQQLRQPCLSPASGPHAQLTGWWSDSQPEPAVQSWVEAHPPSGLSQQGFGSLQSNGAVLACVEFVGTATDAYQEPFVEVTMLPAAGGVELRIDAEVTWRPGKSPLEVVPPRSVGATVIGAYAAGYNRVSTVAAVNLTATEAEQLLGDIDSLPAIVPQEPLECDTDSGYRALITVTTPGGVHETFTDWVACDVVLVSAGGSALPALASSGFLQDDLQEWVGAPPAA